MGAAPAANGFAAGAQAQLRSIIALQRTALAGMRQLNAGSAGGGRGGRRGMAGAAGHGGGNLPGIALALQPGGHGGGLHGIYEQATSLQDAIIRMHLNGLSDSEIADVRRKADEVAAANRSTNPLSNINSIMEARLALGGDLQEAISTAGEMSKMRTILGFSLGKDRAKAAEDATYDALRTAEVRNVVNDPTRRDALFKGMTAAAIASNGRITPKQWHSTAIYGRSATQGLSDEFTNYRLPFLMQEMANGGKGGPAGTALQAMFRAIPMAIQKSSNIGAWRSIGMLNENKVEHGRMGDRLLPGAIKDDKLAISDPDKFVYEVMDRLAKKNGFTDIAGRDRGAMIQALAQFFGTATAQSAVDIMGLQRGRMDNFERTLKMVEDNATLLDQINETASQSVANLNAQMDALKGNIGSSVIPTFTSLVDSAQRFIATVNRGAAVAGGNGNDPTKGGGGVLDGTTLGLIGAGGVLGAARLAAWRPVVGRMMGIGVGAAAGSMTPAGAWGGGVAGGLAGGRAATLFGSTAGSAFLATAGQLVSRFAMVDVAWKAANAVADRTAGGAMLKGLDDRLAGPKLESMRDVTMGSRIRRFLFGDFGDMVTAVTEPSHKAYVRGTGTPIAGARALGGPVLRGQSYLVGERGPEIFTPGQAGAISTHAATRLALAGGNASDDGTGREIRYMSFALVSAVDGVTRAIDRLRGAPATGLEGTAGGSGASGGAVGAGGGRRGFMARAGHFGGGADGGEVTPGGKRVGPVTARGGAGRGLTAARLAAAQESFNFWRSKGATHAQAAAMVANEETESSFNPRAIGDGGSAHGIMQWHKDRRQNILRGRGINVDTANHLEQLEASYWEMTRGNERDGGRRFFAARNEREAVDALVNYYERPADRAGNVRGRTAGALRWAGRFGEGAPIADAGPKVPASVEAAAKAKGERDRRADAAARERPASAGTGATMHVGSVHVHVAAHPHHDERKIAAAVHEQFTRAVHRQLNDGAFA